MRPLKELALLFFANTAWSFGRVVVDGFTPAVPSTSTRSARSVKYVPQLSIALFTAVSNSENDNINKNNDESTSKLNKTPTGNKRIKLTSSSTIITNANNRVHKLFQHTTGHQSDISTSVVVSKSKIKMMFREAKDMERTGRWREACATLRSILAIDPKDAHSHLALARLESRREYRRDSSDNGKSIEHVTPKNHGFTTEPTATALPAKKVETRNHFSAAREAFQTGTTMCPDSVHLWQAWALYEQSCNDHDRARILFQRALQLDSTNPYVCHAFGLMNQRLGNIDAARALWEKALVRTTTAALVCSLGELHVSAGRTRVARDLYARHVSRLQSEREKTEVYLAAAWLEEKHFRDIDRAAGLLNLALRQSPGNSRAQIALAKLEGRRWEGVEKVMAVRTKLREACTKLSNERHARVTTTKSKRPNEVKRDGRLFNAWASLEAKNGALSTAKDILKEGIDVFPYDYSLLQAAGKVEERAGNFTGARDFYSASLMVEPSAPTLVAYAMLEMRHPEQKPCNFTKVARLFEEALLLDPRHGPAYNAYGNMELRRGNTDKARMIYKRGVRAHCTDTASVYHGWGKLELSCGNVELARSILIKGLKVVERYNGMMDNSHQKRAVFLAHTLGMLELNSNRAADARFIFEKGIERHGNSSQLLLGAALCDVKLGKENGARKLFEQAVNADKHHAQAWQSWGVMEMRAGNYNTAKTLFECGIQSDATHGALWQAYGTMESRYGNIEVARALFAAGVRKCPNHVPLYQAWACLELRGENFGLAKKLIGEALTRDKTQGSGWLVAAKIEEKQGNTGLVGLILRRGFECAPNDAELYCALAELEVGRGKIALARELLEKGLEVDPLHAPLYHSLAELEARVFNIEGLAKLNKRAAAVFNNNALIPPPNAMKAWGKKLKNSKSSSRLPESVAALAQMVRVEMDLDYDLMFEVDPESVIQSMEQFENEVVGSVLNNTRP